MSHFPLARASRRRVLLAGLAAAAASAGLSAAAQDAQAAFTLPACGGSSAAKNQGASFQVGAQAYWRTVFATSNGCGGAISLQAFNGNGSGNGLAAMGAGGGNLTINCAAACGATASGIAAGQRDATTAFASTDEPPTPAQQANMNTGTPAPADDGLVHVIPAATGATTILVHAPNGCDLSTVTSLTGGADGTGDTLADKTQRIRISNALLEAAFAGASNADTWGEIAPGISGTPTAGGQNDGLTCANVPVKRIVRSDNSGTTYAFKAFLSLINPSRGWLTTYNANPNTVWPAAGGSGSASPTLTGPAPATSAFCPNSDANKLCARVATGGGALGDAVIATEGSIGYLDLATARSKQFDITAGATQDYTFWSPVENNPGGAATKYVEPTVDPTAHRPGIGARGANCGDAAVSNIPTPAGSPKGDPTLGDWSKAFAAGGAGYSNCVLTYILAWDDSAPIYGNTADEQGKARTVKDFLTTAVVSPAGQLFTAQDYSALPNSPAQPLFKYAQDGVNAIDWNKAGAGGPPGGTPPGNPPGGTPPGNPPGGTPPVVKPSNAFTTSTAKVNKARTSLTYTVKLPGRGRLVAAATYKNGKKTVKVATVTTNATGATTAKITVKLSSTARSALRKKKKLGLSVKFTYTPTGGDARSVTKTVTIRPAAKAKKK